MSSGFAETSCKRELALLLCLIRNTSDNNIRDLWNEYKEADYDETKQGRKPKELKKNLNKRQKLAKEALASS